MATLSIQGLNVGFATEGGRLHALRDVSLEVGAGRIFGIVGESGCGKSTLINAILGLLADNGRVESGRLLFEGTDLLTLAPREMRALRGPRIATVFQDPMGALNPVLSIGPADDVNIQYRSRAVGPRGKDAPARSRCCARCASPTPKRRLGQLSARILRRHEAAHRHRHGADDGA